MSSPERRAVGRRKPGRPSGGKRCKHPPIETFRRVGADGVRLWTCSVCAREAPWSEEHRTYGKIECPKCWGDDVRFVACSEFCAQTADAMGFSE